MAAKSVTRDPQAIVEALEGRHQGVQLVCGQQFHLVWMWACGALRQQTGLHTGRQQLGPVGANGQHLAVFQRFDIHGEALGRHCPVMLREHSHP